MKFDSQYTATFLRLMDFESTYWFEVDRNWGERAADFYIEDGVFAVGDTVMNGRKEIAEFYSWRRSKGDRTSRHLATNFRLSQNDAGNTLLWSIMSLYANDGVPVLDSRPAILMADTMSEFRITDGAKPLFVSHILTPVFAGGVAPTLPTVSWPTEN